MKQFRIVYLTASRLMFPLFLTTWCIVRWISFTSVKGKFIAIAWRAFKYLALLSSMRHQFQSERTDVRTTAKLGRFAIIWFVSPPLLQREKLFSASCNWVTVKVHKHSNNTEKLYFQTTIMIFHFCAFIARNSNVSLFFPPWKAKFPRSIGKIYSSETTSERHCEGGKFRNSKLNMMVESFPTCNESFSRHFISLRFESSFI